MNEEHFEIRSYGFGELAGLYQPQVHPRTAARTLRQWIAKYPGLRHRLTVLGWKPGARLITPAQVKLIIEALGEP